MILRLSFLHLDVTEWLLPSEICRPPLVEDQVVVMPVIAALAALDFLAGTLQIPIQLQDLNITIPRYTKAMIKGNQLHNSFNLPVQLPNLQVRQVL